MAKTPRIPYQPVEDIPNLHKAKISGSKSDALMRELLNSTRFTLTNPSNLKKPSDYKKPIAEILTNQLFMFSVTHYSIRVVVAAAEKYKQYSLVGDALSLAREQVEKVFIVASLLDNPNRNFRQYLRSSWKIEYEKFLLDKEEHKENERFKEFLSDTTPKRLERMRRNQFVKSRKDVLVSKLAMRVLKFSWDNPGERNAPFLKKGTVYNYVKEYFDFATPGRSARKITDPALRTFLYRWHKEYVALSQYTHVTMRKLMFANMVQEKGMAAQVRIKEYGTEGAIRAIHTSYTAAAAACVLVLNEVSNHYGAKDEARQFWEQLISFSLFSKALWKMYIKDVI
jgi:hypothetical protein